MTHAPIIEVSALYHAYAHGGVTEPVLHGVDLRLERGEFVVLMGPSGCGKTTLMSILGLMMTPTRADKLHVAGCDALGLPDAARARLRRESIGFVFQRFNLLPTISAWRNVALPLHLRSVCADGTVDELLERVGLTSSARKKPGQLSVGQQQRVALARALIGRPALLLADEPTGNLDTDNAAAVLALLQEFHRDWGQTILLITHNEDLAVAADRVVHMRDGRLYD